MLLWLLDYWRANAAAAPMLVMRCADTPIGNCEPQRLRKLDLPAVEVSPDHANAAHLAWQAYRSPTPGAWFDLLNADLSLLPQLVPCVVELLEELPAVAAGLGATEMRMLELIAPGDVQPSDLFPGHDKPNQRRVFSYWEVGSLLEELARSPVPAVSGLEEGPFSLEMHADSSRHERYRKSRLSLTEFGKAVLMKQEDFRRHNPIQRWWGGTELISERLWRWDAQSRSPIAP
jgi:hypothetical protein